jgi:uncharacterized protein
MTSGFAVLWLGVVGVIGLYVLAHITVKYTPVIGHHFQAQPVFLPLRVRAVDEGESVEFTAEDGVRLTGTYLPSRTAAQAGVIVYCHEYLSDRWSFRPYVDQLRDAGYDLFTFDFRNHGESDREAAYGPMQWATDRELRDVRAALQYLRTRTDRDPAGFGLFGVSRGGTAAILAGAAEPDVWGVITDGAFPTSGTMVPYMLRWTDLYIKSAFLRALMPTWIFHLLAWTGQRRTERQLNCRFPSVERAVSRLAPRPWFMIHGEADTYISPQIAERLFQKGGEPHELWLVEGAKHNRCLDRDPEAYGMRVYDFLERFAPRRPIAPAHEESVSGIAIGSPQFANQLAPAELARALISPISG